MVNLVAKSSRNWEHVQMRDVFFRISYSKVRGAYYTQIILVYRNFLFWSKENQNKKIHVIFFYFNY